MDVLELLRPRALFRARGRDYRLEHRQGDILFARAVDTEEEALFYLPLGGAGIRLTALGLPPASPGDPALHDLLLRALDLSTLHADAPFLALQRSRVVPANYQLVPLLMALRQPEVRLLLADDVGLGKTVEAGFILKELLLRYKARRVLVLAPAHLLGQWREALRRFFHLEFEVLSGPNLKRLARRLPPGADPWAHFDRVIASLDYAKQDGVRHLVLRQGWDLLLVDEAHLAARPPTERGKQMERYRLVRELSLRVPHLLLTATPHNGYTESFHSLLEHLDAGRLGLFKGGALDREAAKKHVVQRRRRDVEEWFRKEGKKSPFPERDAKEVPVEPNRAERELFEAVCRYQEEVFDPDPAKVPVLGRWLAMHLMRRATSSPKALEESLKRRKALLENLLAGGRGPRGRRRPPSWTPPPKGSPPRRRSSASSSASPTRPGPSRRRPTSRFSSATSRPGAKTANSKPSWRCSRTPRGLAGGGPWSSPATRTPWTTWWKGSRRPSPTRSSPCMGRWPRRSGKRSSPPSPKRTPPFWWPRTSSRKGSTSSTTSPSSSTTTSLGTPTAWSSGTGA